MATIVAKSSTRAICDFLGTQWSMRDFSTSHPNWIGDMFFEKITPPTQGTSGESLEPSGKLPSVNNTKSDLLRFPDSIGRGGPSLISIFHCLKQAEMAGLSSDDGTLEYCLSERALKKALPIFPHSWEAPNINLPLSLPACPGEKIFELTIESISSDSSSFLDSLISNLQPTRS